MAGKASVISGVVRDASGKPVADARVYFTDGPVPLPDTAALTDSKGAFTLSVPAAGKYSIESAADGFATESATVAVARGQQVRLDFHLKR